MTRWLTDMLGITYMGESAEFWFDKEFEVRVALHIIEETSERRAIKIRKLEAQLEEAKKNDHRDPKTGRFVKADEE